MTLKNRVRMTSSVNKDLYAQLKELSDQTRIPISKLLDEGIQYLIKKHETPRS